ncbi:MAG: trigger factor [Kiritimatiellia bacterium]
MQVQVKDAGPCRKELQISVPADQVKSDYSQMLSGYVKQAKIPGFRPGKAPAALVEKRFAKDILEDLKERLINMGYHEAIRQEKLDVVSVLDVRNVSFGKDQEMAFTVVLDVPPVFDLPEYRKIKIKAEKADVTDADVDQALLEVRQRFGTMEEKKDGTVAKGDLVQADYEASFGGRKIEDVAPAALRLGRAEGAWLYADENAFIPGLGDALVGMAIGDTRTIPVEFGADFPEKAVAGQKAEYRVSVKGVRQMKMAELNEDFLKKLGAASEEALREDIRNDIKHHKEYQETGRRKNEITKFLMDAVSFDLPESVVNEETNSAISDIVRNSSQRGVPDEALIEKKDEIFEAASRSAKDKVKLRYILHKIATAEKIEVSDADYRSHVARAAMGYGMDPDKLLADVDKNNRKEKIMDDIRVGRALDLVLAEADIQE